MKKDWEKKVIIALYLIGAIIAAIAMFQTIDWENGIDYIAIIPYFVAVVFLGEMAESMIAKMLGKRKYVAYNLTFIGSVNTVLMLVYIFAGEIDLFVSGGLAANLFIAIVPLIVFGLIPMVKGIKKIFEIKKSDVKK